MHSLAEAQLPAAPRASESPRAVRAGAMLEAQEVGNDQSSARGGDASGARSRTSQGLLSRQTGPDTDPGEPGRHFLSVGGWDRLCGLSQQRAVSRDLYATGSRSAGL